MELVVGRAVVDCDPPDEAVGFASVDDFVDRLSSIGECHDVAVQALDARYVADREHVAKAVTLASRARRRDAAIANDPAVEILLYAAGRRQIDRALEMGVGEGETPVVVVVAGELTAADSDEPTAAAAVRDLLAPTETLDTVEPDRLSAFFEVSRTEQTTTEASLRALVRERVALLAVER